VGRRVSRIVEPSRKPKVSELQVRVLQFFHDGRQHGHRQERGPVPQGVQDDQRRGRDEIAELLKKDLLGGSQAAPHITKRGGEVLARKQKDKEAKA
jgi:hypothetical protein